MCVHMAHPWRRVRIESPLMEGLPQGLEAYSQLDRPMILAIARGTRPMDYDKANSSENRERLLVKRGDVKIGATGRYGKSYKDEQRETGTLSRLYCNF